MPSPTPGAIGGNLTMVISSDGTITGTGTSSQFPDITGNITSSGIGANGQTTLSVTYVEGGVTNTSTLTGTLRLSSDRQTLSDTLSTSVGGTTTSFALSLSQIVG